MRATKNIQSKPRPAAPSSAQACYAHGIAVYLSEVDLFFVSNALLLEQQDLEEWLDADPDSETTRRALRDISDLLNRLREL